MKVAITFCLSQFLSHMLRTQVSIPNRVSFLLFSRSGVGVTGSRQTLFYAEVNDEMRTSGGGGQPEEGELIEVVEIPLEESMKFAYDETFPKTMGVIFSFMWFHSNIAPKLPKK